MPKFVIEREIPGAGSMTAEQLQAAAMKSVEVLKELGPGIQWLHSYFTDNKVYCVYLAADENIIREHARKAGFSSQSDFQGPAVARSVGGRGSRLTVTSPPSRTRWLRRGTWPIRASKR